MTIQKDELKASLEDMLEAYFGKTAKDASEREIFCASAMLLREYASRQLVRCDKSEDQREVHYLSMEFLMGRSLEKNTFNLGLLPELSQALSKLGFEPAEIFEAEPDAGLGNGGLGRLAACYMDSLATLGIPATGYSLCYELGMFRQRIENYRQTELADNWTSSADSWLVPCYDDAVEVRFGGKVEENWDFSGKCRAVVHDYTPVVAVPRDMLITGYRSDRVNVLRLWDARSPRSLDMRLFSGGEYVKSMEERTLAEVITKVLYPADETLQGKILRIRQQYFFVSATAQSVVHKHKQKYGTLGNFAERHVFQINDTHPTMLIPELMRIFMDEEGMGWDEASAIVSKCVCYTNHTVMAEALECWPVEIIAEQMPRIWHIIREIDNRWRAYLERQYPNDTEAVARAAVVRDDKIHMANVCLACCCRVNGVSAMHTEILKHELFRDVYALQPEKFVNVTNGIDHRRWLAQINPELARLISRLLGDEYLTRPEKLAGLEAFAEDHSVLAELENIKAHNKQRFSEWYQRQGGIALNTGAIFDVQVKRLHEYKRQLLCAMLITELQQRIHEHPDAPFLPRTFLFGAKAASSYKTAKRIITLLCSLADDVNSDPLCKGKLQVVFIENYRVTVAEKLMPAAQVSEQISTAGKEASGTGNMKLMMNGAITIGTFDGANVEMYERLGDENMFLFGLRAEEIAALKQRGYDPQKLYEQDSRIRRILNRFTAGFKNGENFSDLVSNLVYGGDPYMVLADFDSYVAEHDKLYAVLSEKDKRAAISLRNIARSGGFAADRAISDYAKYVWTI